MIALLALATLVSEDLTCITAGQLIARGQIAPVAGVFGCFIGIYLGDLALWCVGRALGPRVFAWSWIARRVPKDRAERLSSWFDRHAPGAILAARFLPGARLPMYLGSGMIRRSGARFALWTFVAALLWTPVIVLLVAFAGDAFFTPLKKYLGGGWITLAAAALACFVILRLTIMFASPIGRAKFIARISRIWRWEFLPMWLFYPPVIAWIGWLTLRYRSFMVITAANPGIPHGGFVGESKFQILSLSKHKRVIETILLDREQFELQIAAAGWTFPIVLKPDVGERGAGVKLVRSIEAASNYLARTSGEIIAQPFHPGPFEAGVFYYRIPGEAHGRIFSITDKVFPELLGDGSSTIEQLIWQHPRFRMQARTFLARHVSEASRILAPGERFRLAMAGNHCQGTLFRDGAHLITPSLERAVDQIARSFNGFFFGRFDIRYSDVARFRAGEDLWVIELNGVTSESTNIYDPSWSLLRAYRTLFRQWSLLFRIGHENTRRGGAPSSAIVLIREIVRSQARVYPGSS
ncbi:hypothetical protein BH09PLA1_BH09PLA1_04870 [soil metagenome]